MTRTMTQELYEQFVTKTGIQINDIGLLKTALTHRSTRKKQHFESNERLEFLGDAVLEFIVSKELYERFQDKDEGYLTKIRSALVRKQNLAKVARKLGLGEFIVLGKGEHDSGGRDKDYILANTVEAIIGALFLDQGLAITAKFVLEEIVAELGDIIKYELYNDAKTQLQEYTQGKRKITPKYITLKTEGPEHDKHFVVVALIGSKKYLKGKGKTKQEAQEDSAQKTLKHIVKFGF